MGDAPAPCPSKVDEVRETEVVDTEAGPWKAVIPFRVHRVVVDNKFCVFPTPMDFPDILSIDSPLPFQMCHVYFCPKKYPPPPNFSDDKDGIFRSLLRDINSVCMGNGFRVVSCGSHSKGKMDRQLVCQHARLYRASKVNAIGQKTRKGPRNPKIIRPRNKESKCSFSLSIRLDQHGFYIQYSNKKKFYHCNHRPLGRNEFVLPKNAFSVVENCTSSNTAADVASSSSNLVSVSNDGKTSSMLQTDRQHVLPKESDDEGPLIAAGFDDDDEPSFKESNQGLGVLGKTRYERITSVFEEWRRLAETHGDDGPLNNALHFFTTEIEKLKRDQR